MYFHAGQILFKIFFKKFQITHYLIICINILREICYLMCDVTFKTMWLPCWIIGVRLRKFMGPITPRMHIIYICSLTPVFLIRNIQGFFYRFCDFYHPSEMVRLTSIFSGVDFNFATKSNLTEPKDWLLYDTGFVLQMKKKWSQFA